MIVRLQQLVLQSTPFCNIDCRYCYLPERSNRGVMSEETLHALFTKVLRAEYLKDELSIVWALGEPLAAPIAFYERALETAASMCPAGVKLRHSFQTNATLATESWCRFIKKWEVGVGVSIDGPAALHDANRVTRSGKGTFEKTMDGLRLFRAHGIEPSVLSVISQSNLDSPDALFDFYEENDIRHVGINVEELDGANRSSSLTACSVDERFRNFLRRAFHRFEQGNVIRSFREYDPNLILDRVESFAKAPILSIDRLQLLAVDYQGNFTFFGPELLGGDYADSSRFVLGNVLNDNLEDVVHTDKFRWITGQIDEGIRACMESCRYFGVCGGGTPSNKYYEHGTFSAAETQYCRLRVKAVADVLREITNDIYKSEILTA